MAESNLLKKKDAILVENNAQTIFDHVNGLEKVKKNTRKEMVLGIASEC